jgi:hypothetical protein
MFTAWTIRHFRSADQCLRRTDGGGTQGPEMLVPGQGSRLVKIRHCFERRRQRNAVTTPLCAVALALVMPILLRAQPPAPACSTPDADANLVLLSVKSWVATSNQRMRSHLTSLGIVSTDSSAVVRVTVEADCARARAILDSLGVRPPVYHQRPVQLIRIGGSLVVDWAKAIDSRMKPAAVLDSSWALRGVLGVSTVPTVSPLFP